MLRLGLSTGLALVYVAKPNEAIMLFDNDLLLICYKQIINCIDNEVYVKNRDGIYVVANQYYQLKLVGLGILKSCDESVLGKSDYDLFPKAVAHEFARNDHKVILSGKELVAREVVKISKYATRRFVSHKRPCYDSNNNIIGVLGNSFEVADIAIGKLRVELSKREIDCLAGIYQGKTAARIGQELLISKRTVESYIENLKIKLMCKNKSELIKLVLENNLEQALKRY